MNYKFKTDKCQMHTYVLEITFEQQTEYNTKEETTLQTRCCY